MNAIQKNLIVAICLLAFVGGLFVLKYAVQKQETSQLEKKVENTEHYAKLNEEKVKELSVLAEDARQKAMSNLENAAIARKMLEKTIAEKELNQKQILDVLNAQLEREASARTAAEAASIELAKQRDILSKAVEEAKETITRLQSQKSDDSNLKRIDTYQELIKQKDAEIASLKKRQEELLILQRQAEESQKNLEKEITERGGTINIPKPMRLLSPNIRKSN